MDYQPNNSQNQYNSEKRTPADSNGLAIASMVIGIISVSFCCFVGPLSIILGVVGLVLALLSKRDYRWNGFSIAGIATSSVGIILGIIYFLYIWFFMPMWEAYVAAGIPFTSFLS